VVDGLAARMSFAATLPRDRKAMNHTCAQK
jgi:hypothetical protein